LKIGARCHRDPVGGNFLTKRFVRKKCAKPWPQTGGGLGMHVRRSPSVLTGSGWTCEKEERKRTLD